MKWRLFKFTSAVSLLICVASAAIWARSWRAADELIYRHYSMMAKITSIRGRIVLERSDAGLDWRHWPYERPEGFSWRTTPNADGMGGIGRQFRIDLSSHPARQQAVYCSVYFGNPDGYVTSFADYSELCLPDSAMCAVFGLFAFLTWHRWHHAGINSVAADREDACTTSRPMNYAPPPAPLASYRLGRLFTVVATLSMVLCLAILTSWSLAEPHWHWIMFGQSYGIDAGKESLQLWIDNFEYPWRVPYCPLAIATGIPALIWIAKRLGFQLPRKAADRVRPVSRRRSR